MVPTTMLIWVMPPAMTLGPASLVSRFTPGVQRGQRKLILRPAYRQANIRKTSWTMPPAVIAKVSRMPAWRLPNSPVQ